MTGKQHKPDPIIEKLDELRETPERDPKRAAQSRQQFLSQVEEISRQTVSISWIQRLINVFRMPEPQMRFSTLTIGVVLGLLLISFSGSVAAASRALPNDFLYPYKIWLEDQRLALTSRSSSKLNLRLDYAEERLAELEGVDEALTDDDLGEILANFYRHLSAAEDLADEFTEDDDLLERLEALREYDEDDDVEEGALDEQEDIEDEKEPSKTAKPGDDPEKTPSPEDTDTTEETESLQATDKPRLTEDPEETDTPEEETETDDPDETEEPDETEDPDETEEPDETP